MKKLKLIYNPFSGDKNFKFSLDAVINILQQANFECHIFRAISEGDIAAHIKQMPTDYDTIVAAGGDGTINIVLNGMIKHGHKSKLGIIPSGTANDFATFLRINQINEAAETIARGHITPVDIGVCNDDYFINVCAAGHFTNISHKIDVDFKNMLGKMAYYIKGLEEMPNLSSEPLRITNSEKTYSDSYYLFLVLNTSGTGGITNIVKDASISDGLFDFVAVSEFNLTTVATLFLALMRNEHLNDPRVLYFQDKYVKIEHANPKHKMETTLDGEAGSFLPVEIKNIQRAVKIYVP